MAKNKKMLHGSRRAKGRRLQVELAEALSQHFRWTIEAVPPTRPGKRANGAVWIAEDQHPDLRVRRSGEAGVDVALLTPRAQERLTMEGKKLFFECKNVEKAWDFGPQFWVTGNLVYVSRLLRDLSQRSLIMSLYQPAVVLGKNRWPPLVAWHASVEQCALLGQRGAPVAHGGPWPHQWTITSLYHWMRLFG